MKDNRGFTLVEIIVVIGLLAIITGIFIVNFTSNLKNTKVDTDKKVILDLENAAKAYVSSSILKKDASLNDINLAITNADTYTYISLVELLESGFINEIPTIEGKELDGLIKLTANESGDYTLTYEENAPSHITVVYRKNGANSIGRTARIIMCESKEISAFTSCASNIYLPTINRVDGNGLGWSINPNAQTSNYKAETLLGELLKNEITDIKDGYIYLYAISSKVNRVSYFVDSELIKEEECTAYNTNDSCEITVSSVEKDRIIDSWTQENMMEKIYKSGERITLKNNISLVPEGEVTNG